MKRYVFGSIRLQGYGETAEAAWNDALEQFNLDPGPPPEYEDGTLDAEVFEDEE